MAKKDIWDVTALMGQAVVITAEGMPATVGTIVEQDTETITILTPARRPVIVTKKFISSLTQKAEGEM